MFQIPFVFHQNEANVKKSVWKKRTELQTYRVTNHLSKANFSSLKVNLIKVHSFFWNSLPFGKKASTRAQILILNEEKQMNFLKKVWAWIFQFEYEPNFTKHRLNFGIILIIWCFSFSFINFSPFSRINNKDNKMEKWVSKEEKSSLKWYISADRTSS